MVWCVMLWFGLVWYNFVWHGLVLWPQVLSLPPTLPPVTVQALQGPSPPPPPGQRGRPPHPAGGRWRTTSQVAAYGGGTRRGLLRPHTRELVKGLSTAGVLQPPFPTSPPLRATHTHKSPTPPPLALPLVFHDLGSRVIESRFSSRESAVPYPGYTATPRAKMELNFPGGPEVAWPRLGRWEAPHPQVSPACSTPRPGSPSGAPSAGRRARRGGVTR